LILVTRMVPRMTLVVPYYLLMLKVGMLDTYSGLVIAYISFAMPFSIWLLIGSSMTCRSRWRRRPWWMGARP